LLGPSGCGKTTTLRMIAGLETPTSGRITIDGVPVFDSQKGINVSANKRKVGFLFQNYALWPNMTVYQNISFGLTNIKEEMDEIDFNARTAARMIEILQKPQDVVRAINECVDKKKKLNLDKAYLRLIDLYEISLFTAKTLMGMKLQEAGDPKAAAAQEIKKLEEKLAAAKATAEMNGCTLSDDYLTKGGKPVRSMRRWQMACCPPRLPHRQNRHVHGSLSQRAFRRPAAARGHRPHACAKPEGALHG
ncbi:MAG: ATP-binding cassette domain-containing protein, partial [Christensenellales bacterium]